MNGNDLKFCEIEVLNEQNISFALSTTKSALCDSSPSFNSSYTNIFIAIDEVEAF